MYLTARSTLQNTTTQACSKPTKKELKECKNMWTCKI